MSICSVIFNQCRDPSRLRYSPIYQYSVLGDSVQPPLSATASIDNKQRRQRAYLFTVGCKILAMFCLLSIFFRLGLNAVCRCRGCRCRRTDRRTQWRSQECELAGLHSLAPPRLPLSPLPSSPLLTGVRGYNRRNFF